MLLAVSALFSLSMAYDQVGAPLAFPKVYANADVGATVEVDLDLAVFQYKGPNVTQNTRAYNGEMVGPTIRVKPGQTLIIRLHNSLTPELCDTSAVENRNARLNTTSLHTHGLHISGEGNADNALVPVPPGTSREYVYPIPADHMGGTFWYHPHVHGAGSMQAGGGASGMLIIEDDRDALQLPAAVAEAEDMPLMLTHLDMPWINQRAGYYKTACLKNDATCTPEQCTDPMWGVPPTRGKAVGNVLLVNGMTRPTIRLVANRWYRWRLLLHSGGGPDYMPHLRACDVGLLAKDGIYLHSAPRMIKMGFMAAGNRADWLVRCPAGTHQFAMNVTTVLSMDEMMGRRSLHPGHSHGPTRDPRELWPVATVVAVDEGVAAVDVPTFAPRRPCYLADLRKSPAPARELSFDMRSMYFINGHSWHGQDVLEFPPLEVGTLVDVSVYGLGYNNYIAHIFHAHVHSLQLMEEPPDTFGGYFQKGDWHDTIKGPPSWKVDAPFKFRTQIDRFTGKVLAHCHYLWHQDWGMMVMLQVDGKDGTRYPGARALDPTCYADTDALPSVADPRSVPSRTDGGVLAGAVLAGVGIVAAAKASGVYDRVRRLAYLLV